MSKKLSEQLDEFAFDLERDMDRIEEELEEAVEETAEELETLMKSAAPKGESGDLKRSISAEKAGNAKYVVGPEEAIAPYAEYVEFGTGTKREGGGGDSYYITPDGLDPEQVLAATSMDEYRALAEEYGALHWDGADHPVLMVEHPGRESNPFWRPATNIAEEEDWLTENVDRRTPDIFKAFGKK